MRIGEINKENYMDYMKMFGGNNTKALDEMWDKDKKNTTLRSAEEINADLIKMGYVEEGMLHEEGDVSWKKIVPISDDMKNKIYDLLRSEFIQNNGKSDGEAFRALTKNYIKNSPVNERASVAWSIDQLWIDEAQRLTDYVKEKVPGWRADQPFDRSILHDYVPGGIDVKA